LAPHKIDQREGGGEGKGERGANTEYTNN